jgi:hypothetical protein
VADNSRTLTITMLGAVLGAAGAYLFFTPEGRALQRRIEPAIDDLTRELSSFRGTVTRASAAATEGWKLLHDTLGETRAGTQTARYSDPHQSSPF